VVISLAVTGIVAQNNLFATSGSNDFGLIVSCSAGLVSAFQNNVFLQPTTVVRFGGGGTTNCGATAQSFDTVTDAQAFLAATSSGSKVSGNMRLASSCGADGACTVDSSCNSAASCESEIITGWAPADTGYAILQSAGWKIAAKCAVSQGGFDLSATLETDFYGAARTKPLSAGAHEQDATCAN
jgi:hypothetical protein